MINDTISELEDQLLNYVDRLSREEATIHELSESLLLMDVRMALNKTLEKINHFKSHKFE